MTNPTNSILIALALLAGVLRGLADAQTPQPLEAVAAVELLRTAQDADAVACVFTGEPPALEGATRADGFRRRVAAIELLVDVDRDFAEAERRYALLRGFALGAEPWEGQREVVVLITARLAELQLARRAPERALRALTELLPRLAPEELAGEVQFAAADEAWLEREREWREDPRLVALRTRVEAQLARRAEGSAGAPGTGSQELTDEIWRDLQRGGGQLTKAMGSAAVPALRELTLRSVTDVDVAAVGQFDRDPLQWLVDFSPDDALDVVLANLGGSPLVWRKRVVRAMLVHRVLMEPRRAVQDRLLLDEPRWLDVLDGLLGDPRLWDDLVPLLRLQSMFSDWTPVQAAAVRARLLSSDVADVRRLREASPWSQRRPSSVQPGAGVPVGPGMRQLELLEAALSAEQVEARELAAAALADMARPQSFVGHLEGATTAMLFSFDRAAEIDRSAFRRLLEGPRADALLDELSAAIEGQPAELRLEIAQQLCSPVHRGSVPAERLRVFAEDEDPGVRVCVLARLDVSSKDRLPTSAAEHELLRVLLRDPVSALREQAMSCATRVEAPPPLTLDELLALASDESTEVRSYLPWMPVADLEKRARVLAALASDPEQQVVESAESVAQSLVQQDPRSLPALLPYFAARLDNPAFPALAGPGEPNSRLHLFLNDARGLRIALEHLRGRPERSPAGLVALFYRWRQRQGFAERCQELPAEDLRLLLRLAADTRFVPSNFPGGGFHFRQLLEQLLPLDTPAIEGAMEGLTGDAGANRTLRINAHAWCMRHRAERSTDALLAFLREPTWETVDLQEGEVRGALGNLSRSIDERQRNAVALRVVQDRAIPDELAERVTLYYRPEAPGGVEVSRAMLARWLTPETTYCRADTALRHLGGVPGEVEPALLRHALKLNVRGVALNALAQLKDPQLLPALAECLNPSWIDASSTRQNFAKEAAFAISQYMTDEAAEVLLAGIQTVETDEVRQACFDALERIRLYQEARERLGRRDVGRAKRDGAVRELVALLEGEDPAQVAAAARGLAALGAVDELPALIRLMKHPLPEVRAAAEEAVARLTAPPEGGE